MQPTRGPLPTERPAPHADELDKTVVDAAVQMTQAEPELAVTRPESFQDEAISLAVTQEHPGRYQGPRTPGEKPAPGPIELGRGGIGRVLIAHDAHLGREVAVKELLKKTDARTGNVASTNPRESLAAARFLREARLTGQLEHPNIVPVYELGKRGDGTLYYTMKVVRGKNLGAALSRAKSLPERLKLLNHYADLCDAIAYAHSRGVIHRDIKPENVMVGEFGETVVLDWGLAKPKGGHDPHEAQLMATEVGERVAAGLSGDAQETDTVGGPRRVHTTSEGEGGIAATNDGTLIGTPLYMSPEQAQGDLAAVDERTDVWALGVVLYEILTGEPPFGAKTAVELLIKIVKGGFAPVRSKCPEAPPELAAICEKALSRDPDRRYADARGMAEEIRAYLTGGRVAAYSYGAWRLFKRWAARHKAALTVAAAAAVALITLGVVSYVEIGQERDLAMAARSEALAARDEAQRARDVAEGAMTRAQAAEKEARASRDDAERLVRFMVSDLKDRLEPLGQLPLLDGVATAIADHYRRTEQRAPSMDAAQRRNRAAVSALMGDIYRARGDLASAGVSYRQAEALREALLAEDPGSAELRFDRSESHRQAGLLARAQGDLVGARLAFDAARKARQELFAQDGANAEHRRALIESELDRGDLAALMGDLKAAEQAFEAAVELARGLVAASPDDPRARFELSIALDALGTARLDMDRHEDARPTFSESLALRRELVAAHPGNLDWLHRVAVSHARLAEVEEAAGRLDEAKRSWSEAATLMERLVAQDPGQARWQRDLVVDLNRLGDLEIQAGRPAEALTSFEKALSQMVGLAARDASNAELMRDLEVGHNRVGDALVVLGRLPEALMRYDQGLALAERLATLDPTNTRWQHDLAQSLVKVATVRAQTGDAPLAEQQLSRAVALLAALVERDPSNAGWGKDLELARAQAAKLASGQLPLDVGAQPQRPQPQRPGAGGSNKADDLEPPVVSPAPQVQRPAASAPALVTPQPQRPADAGKELPEPQPQRPTPMARPKPQPQRPGPLPKPQPQRPDPAPPSPEPEPAPK